MRDAEEELDLKERIDLQGGLDSGTTHDNNPPQSLAPSQAATMPRPPSCKSITRGFKDMEISDGTQQGKQKRKAMRHGPLDKCTKARAALMRKLGACQKCCCRRVKCTHHDWTKFETEYQTSKDPPANPPTIPSYNHQAMSSAAYSLPVQCWQPTKPQDLEMDLIGVGHNPATLAPPTVSLGWDAEHDFGLVLQSHGSYQNWPASSDDHPLSNAFGAHQPPPSTVSTLWDQCLPIGRQVSEARDEWECQWRNDGTGSLISSGGGEACPHRHLTLRELRNHCSCAHGQYRKAEEPFFGRCMDCQFDNNRPGPCPQCRQGYSSSSEK
ncbi:hypothetical protein QBC33DRAFT_370220 [Phialemonium atrogriseum]|uniref:Uncharacterized protein n=1 Tax=Phialemonium atrogriseum TaxID=1093897 RepID=A0AAJ0FNH4_9PEZI|nr:uncharacterized protein QBC33DRAFT_370220 [Phialemonium atrogriseum]KAK1769004.1 hypothetical protein QBC33DRAFT_370220 [Phialemonium atrogriseum]